MSTTRSAREKPGAASARKRAAGRQRAAVGRPRKDVERAGAADRILDAAEDLFSKRGFDGVTIREVTALANVDTALAHYYFSTKQGLFDAVLERRAEQVFAERMQAFDRFEAECGERTTVEGAVATFLTPLLSKARTGDIGWKNYFRLLSVVNNDPLHVAPSVLKYFDPLVHRLVKCLKRALPQAREADLYWCFQFLTGSLTLALSRTGRIDRLSGGLCKSDDLGAIEPRLIAYCAAGLRGVCAAPPPRPGLRKPVR
jgi:AcrR family transcriptional regulator